ncbi:MAG: AI-2E family transporter [Sandaracinus sp.]|nr:AI-2E family transporter [Sandaracinus sp.]MCB9632647.1 AI-2E family transporter [Sandaracinus sp.]
MSSETPTGRLPAHASASTRSFGATLAGRAADTSTSLGVFERGSSPRIARTLLAIALGIYLLRITAFVTMPLAVAAFAAILVWPVQRALSRRVPHGVAFVLTSLLVLGVLGGLTVLVGWIVSDFVADLPTYQEMVGRGTRWIRRELGVAPEPPALFDGAMDAVSVLATRVGVAAVALLFTLLAVEESNAWRQRVLRLLSRRVPDARVRASAVANVFREYFALHTLVSALTGAITAALCWFFGVRDPQLWGLLAFVLNYVPNLGSAVAVVPPMLVAGLDEGLGHALLLGGALTLCQMFLGSWLEPRLQSRSFGISPLVALVAVLVWGWVWGIGGALIAVPLTVFLVTLLEASPRWEWLAELVRVGGGDHQRPRRPSISESLRTYPGTTAP